MSLVSLSWPIQCDQRTHYVRAVIRRAVVQDTWLNLKRNQANLLPWFSEDECKQLVRFPVLKRQVDWLAGRLVAKACAQYLRPAQQASDVVFTYDAFGRPCWVNGYYCSLSHTHERAVAVVAAQPVGVDVETLRNRQSELLKLFVFDDEIRTVKTRLLVDENHAYAVLWSLKEAFFKAVGQGDFLTFARAVRLLHWVDHQLQWQVALNYQHVLLPLNRKHSSATWAVDLVIEQSCLEVVVFNPIFSERFTVYERNQSQHFAHV